MRIGEASRTVGVPTHRLRHYEDAGLLSPARTPGGYRWYGPADVDRARLITALFASGFSAKDAALLLPCLDEGPADAAADDPRRCCEVTRARLDERLTEISDRRRALQRTEEALSAWLAQPLGQG
ncbi:MerR family transcriptional regulator [Brachybacterium sp. ACRRE]|uniref:MerR family transcriptional regulator n=1 Tax=Brachybacterium sp. ACRRE TaxID=2918184 RepID=UPI001EF3735A|nr:MerR family transcriptional regulator [Brachybacterium sp. ACRRE]MCG7310847.1 MerR family transcriptional regulator [Brachybacterium sp. ACRRE]